jgi:hypothetical protein
MQGNNFAAKIDTSITLTGLSRRLRLEVQKQMVMKELYHTRAPVIENLSVTLVPFLPSFRILLPVWVAGDQIGLRYAMHKSIYVIRSFVTTLLCTGEHIKLSNSMYSAEFIIIIIIISLSAK